MPVITQTPSGEGAEGWVRAFAEAKAVSAWAAARVRPDHIVWRLSRQESKL